MSLDDIHPGEILLGLLEDSEITQTSFAGHIGATPGYINDICRGRRNISPAMAIKISAALGGTPEHWLRLQNAFDLYLVKKQSEKKGAPTIEQMEIAA